MPNNKSFSKRNLFLLGLWSAMLIALIAGTIVNVSLHQKGLISDAMFSRRVWYAALCFFMMSLLYIFEFFAPIRFSLFLEIVLPLFAFTALGGGTVFDLYHLPGFDKVLHTLSGPLFAIVGFAFADLCLKDQPEGKRKAVAAVLIAFLFALSIGYLWELFEYSVDSLIPGFNNQRWQQGVLEELGNGTFIVSDARGTALHDTMWDMFVNFFGATAFLIPALIFFLRRPSRLKAFSMEKKKALSF